MTDQTAAGLAEQAIRDALAAGPTPGPWLAEINNIGTHVAASQEGDVYPRNIADLVVPFWAVTDPDDKHGVRARVQADTNFIAACNPANITALLAQLEEQRAVSARMEADARRFQWLLDNANIDHDPSEPYQLVIWEPDTGQDWRAIVRSSIDAAIASQQAGGKA